ncbi:pollen-specific leucine-rich repeat extensin-like protein 1 [Tanacetum coccineum]
MKHSLGAKHQRAAKDTLSAKPQQATLDRRVNGLSVEDIDGGMTRYMANPNRVGGVTNDASLREYEDYDGYDDFKYYVDDLNKEQLAFCDAWDIGEEEKVTVMILYVDLKCPCCYKKVRKLLCKFPQIRDQVFDEDNNKVIITVVCCDPERFRDKLCCKGGRAIQSIEIVEKKPPKQPAPALLKLLVKTQNTEQDDPPS